MVVIKGLRGYMNYLKSHVLHLPKCVIIFGMCALCVIPTDDLLKHDIIKTSK